MQSQEEHAPSTITFDQKTLISTAALGDLSDKTLTRIATFLEQPLDTWLCPDRMVKVVYIKAATGDNAAVHLSATVSTTNKPSIEGFLKLQLEEPGTGSKLTVRDLLGICNVTGAQLRHARYRSKGAPQIQARYDLHVQRERKRKVDLITDVDDLDQQISDLDQQIGDCGVEGRMQASTKRPLVRDGTLSNDGHGINAPDVGSSNCAGAAVWVTRWSRSSNV